MDTKRFKTNLRCEGCVAKVTPLLDATVGKEAWDVDLETADSELTVTGEKVDAQQIVAVLQQAGYEAVEKRGFFKKVFG